jgi:hypothetical protein
MMIYRYANISQLYGECILFWMLENSIDLDQLDDYQTQLRSGLSETEFQIGLQWLVNHEFIGPRSSQIAH